MLKEVRLSQGLSSRLSSVLTDIKSSLFAQATYANPSVDFDVPIVEWGQVTRRIRSPSSERVVEVPEDAILPYFPGVGPGGSVRALTLYEPGKILLSQGYWCLETLIHECLHALSIFGVRRDLVQPLRPFVEGLTEFMTGYVLSKRYEYTFTNCFNSPGKPCHFTYPLETKIWCAFCHVIGVSSVLPLYFWNNNSDWSSLCDTFISSVQTSGYKKFKNFVNMKGGFPLMSRFHDECVRNFKMAYLKPYRQMLTRLDYSEVRP